MTTLLQGSTDTVSLAAQTTIAITSPTGGSVRVTRLDPSTRAPISFSILGSGESLTLGPYSAPTIVRVECLVNSATFVVGSVDPATTLTVNAQTGTAYTLVSTDNGIIVTLNNASPITLTVPSGLDVGFSCQLIQIGAGQVTVVGSGATVNGKNGLKLSGQHAQAGIASYASNVFNLGGDTSA